MFVCLNGKIVDEKEAKVSVFDHGFAYGDGIYETLRTVDGQIWLYKQHMDRFRDSAADVGMKIPYDDAEISAFIADLMERDVLTDAQIRITLTRGENNFDFTEPGDAPTFVIVASKLKRPPIEYYEKGVKVITYKGERVLPHIKSTAMLTSSMARRAAKKAGAYEAFLIDRDGNMREGSISNVFIVQGSVLVTPKDGILRGTVRDFVIELLKDDFEIEERPVTLDELYEADEIFLTSSIKGVMPVVKVDGKMIGDGIVGSRTREIITKLADSL